MRNCTNCTRKSEKEVCLCDTLEHTRRKGIFMNSKNGKITYDVTHDGKEIFDNRKYQPLFDILNGLEKDLEKPLEFTIALDYMTLETFMHLLKDTDYKKLISILGTRLFYLVNDIALKKSLDNPDVIADYYFFMQKITSLKEFYDKNEELVIESFNKKFSSLPLFDLIYEGSDYSLISSLYDQVKIQDDNAKKKLACSLILELKNHVTTITSESTKEDFYYDVYYINTHFNKLTHEEAYELLGSNIEDVYCYMRTKFSA